MFADDDDKPKEAAAAPAAAAPVAAAPAAAAPAAAAPAAAPPRAAAPAKQQQVCRTGGLLVCSCCRLAALRFTFAVDVAAEGLLLPCCTVQEALITAAQINLQADKTDYSSWPVKELRRFLTERGVVSPAVGAGTSLGCRSNNPPACCMCCCLGLIDRCSQPAPEQPLTNCLCRTV